MDGSKERRDGGREEGRKEREKGRKENIAWQKQMLLMLVASPRQLFKRK